MCFCHLFTQLLSVHLVILFSSRESRSLPFSDLLHFRPTNCHSCSNFSRLAEPLGTRLFTSSHRDYHHRDRYRSLATANTIRDISFALKAHNSFWWRGPATKPFHMGNDIRWKFYRPHSVACFSIFSFFRNPSTFRCVALPPSDLRYHLSIATSFSPTEMLEKILVWSNGPPAEMFSL